LQKAADMVQKTWVKTLQAFCAPRTLSSTFWRLAADNDFDEKLG
jgi:hypothetical protein